MQQFFDLFQNKQIKDIWPKERPIITFKSDQLVTECLRILESERILAAPVMDCDEPEKCIGIADMNEIVLFICDLDAVKKWRSSSNKNQSLDQVIKGISILDETTIGQIMSHSKTELRESTDLMDFTMKTDAVRLIALFYLGLHRTPILSEDKKKVVNFITQADLLQIVGQTLPLIDREYRMKTLKDVNVGTMFRLITAKKDDITIDVLHKMHSSSPTTSAVPVLDDEDRVIATFSFSNLKGLTTGNFHELFLPVYEYLKLQTTKEKSFHVTVMNKKALNPITCTPNTTIESAISTMVAMRLHRLWSVDPESGKLVGLATLSDIFQVLLPQDSLSPCFIL